MSFNGSLIWLFGEGNGDIGVVVCWLKIKWQLILIWKQEEGFTLTVVEWFEVNILRKMRKLNHVERISYCFEHLSNFSSFDRLNIVEEEFRYYVDDFVRWISMLEITFRRNLNSNNENVILVSVYNPRFVVCRLLFEMDWWQVKDSLLVDDRFQSLIDKRSVVHVRSAMRRLANDLYVVVFELSMKFVDRIPSSNVNG